jgi:amidase/aspartyl-tRNA(Asn)/glutamyl-tRNA(Gln) amidotransferase subunit A
VAVATGAVFIALGSDTGGSVRIPAAMNGVVGFKPTTGLIPTTGAVPLSTTLDTVGPLARSVRDAALALSILAQQRVMLKPHLQGLQGLRIGVPRTLMLDALDDAVASAFSNALSKLSQAGAQIEEFDLPLLSELGGLQAKAGFSSVEGLAWHRAAGSWQRQEAIDPRVLLRMGAAEATLAIDYVQLHAERRRWIARCECALAGFDVLASPTVPITARPVADVIDNTDAFLTVNAMMLRNTAPVNFLGGPAISIPIQRSGDLGVGMMLWALPHADQQVLNAAQAAEQSLHNT